MYGQVISRCGIDYVGSRSPFLSQSIAAAYGISKARIGRTRKYSQVPL